MMGAVARQQLFLIDSFGFIFRAYHARARSGAPPMRTSTGFSTEAVYIFNNMLRKLSKQYNPGLHRRGFRERRAHPPRPGVRRIQGQSRRDAARPAATRSPTSAACSKPCAFHPGVPGFRGRRRDRHARPPRRGGRAWTWSSSPATRTCCNWSTTASPCSTRPRTTSRYDAGQGEEFMGVRPDQVADLLALKGDAVDNIPGAPGIGDKGAKDLIDALRVGRGGARARRRSREEDLPREPAEQRRAHPHEQAPGDHRHRRAGGVHAGRGEGAGSRPGAAQGHL